MAVTEAAEAHTAGESHVAVATPATGGFVGTLGTVDHVTIGRLFVVTSLVFLVVGRVAGVLVDVERLDTSSVSILDEYLGQVFSLHLVADPFLFLLPAFLGVAIAVVPLQVGAATVAFPRAAAAAFWTWLLSGGVLLTSYFIDGGLPPFGTDRDGTLLTIVGLGGVVAGLLLATVCVLTTVLALRTAGMTVDRVPMFAWGTFVAGVVWLISLPVLVAVLVLAYVDVRYGAGVGASSRLAWAFGIPQIFAFAFPAVGVLLDVVPVAAGARNRSRGVLLGATALAAFLTFGADTMAGGDDPSIFQDVFYVGASIALLLALLVIAGGVANTLRRGRLNLSGPLFFGLLGFVLVLTGAAINAVRVIDEFDLVGTSADSAVTELAIVGGLLGVGGALQFWATKLFGAQLREGLGRLAAIVIFLGGLAVGVPDFISGFLDQPYGAGALPFVEDGVEALNAVALVGGVLVLVGVLLLVLNLVAGRNGDDDDGAVPADPWDGHTLEWATTSPPTPGGLGPIEAVTSATPLLDQKESDH